MKSDNNVPVCSVHGKAHKYDVNTHSYDDNDEELKLDGRVTALKLQWGCSCGNSSEWRAWESNH